MTEKEILKQEELDFGSIFNRFFRAWPIVLISVMFFLCLGVLFLVTFPPSYSARTSFLLEKPLGVNDASTLIAHYPVYRSIDDYYYKNEKLRLIAYPSVKQAIEDLGLRFTYIKSGIFNADIYEKSPFHLEVEESYFETSNVNLPLVTPFYVSFTDNNTYHIEAEGEYPVTEYEYEFEGDHGFGQWVTYDAFKFRLILDIELGKDVDKDEYYTENTFGFILNDPDAVALELIEGFELVQDEIDATVIGITTAGATALKAKDILGKLGEVYVGNHMADKTDMLDRAISFLDTEIQANLEQLQIIEQETEAYKVKNGVTGANEIGLLVSKESMELENQKVSILLKRKYYKYLETYLKENKEYHELISPNAFGIKDPLISDLTNNLVKQSSEKALLEQSGTQANPLYERLTSSMEADKRTILRTIDGFDKSNDIALEQVDDRIRKVDGDIRDLPRVQNRLQQMERMSRIHESLYKTHRENRASIALSRVSVSPDAKNVEPPYLISLKPTFPNPIIILIIALLLGLIMPIMWVLVKAIFNTKIDTGSELEGLSSSMPMIGEISNTGIRTGTELQSYSGSKLGQEIGHLIQRVDSSEPNVKCIAFSSARSEEGKTFLSAMMAVRYARAGQRVLLIDSNLVSPHLHEHFGRKNSGGLAEVMAGTIPLKDAIQNTSVERVELLTAGRAGGFQDWSGEVLAELIAASSSVYDKVIIDTAPMGEVSETMDVISRAGYIIMVTRRAITSKSEIEELEVLKKNRNDLPAMGLVITDVFEQEVSLNPFKKKSKYYDEKPSSLSSRIMRLFKKI